MLKLVIAYFIIFSLGFVSFLDCTRIENNQRHETGVLNHESPKSGWYICKEVSVPGFRPEWCCACNDKKTNCYSTSDDCKNFCAKDCAPKK
ncbi:hypothetical protein HanXRQr2_Chr13g0607331 [Helianthus annuus]|uniref:Uncharacterized protein n=1 Tax=Helianthus annuus TaxID=4232 RepID=A0A251SZ83_HELAN|nr:hypothetical protein HanXRQr2_Chr13g0607331 [Helianthus annuus]KAJ0850848.1 hypothetical protein HanPSC8_Chr13g0585601 [Helianthus annuus]